MHHVVFVLHLHLFGFFFRVLSIVNFAGLAFHGLDFGARVLPGKVDFLKAACLGREGQKELRLHLFECGTIIHSRRSDNYYKNMVNKFNLIPKSYKFFSL